MIYSVMHITHFAYTPAIRESVMEVRMQPRSEGHQRCLSFDLDVNPPAHLMIYRDFLGNAVHHFDIPGRHNLVRLTAQAIVEVLPMPLPMASDTGSWADLKTLVAKGDYWEMLLPSRYAKPTALLEGLAREFKLDQRQNPLDLLLALNDSMYHAFEYVPNSTKVDSPIDDALKSRQGVCQDFAHIMIALGRYLGIPCRYVSGYLYHGDQVHPDRSADGASHAWAEAFLPGVGWISLDPTNNLLGSERHIRVAIGRDYADVPPTRGVYKGDAESVLSVAVVVAPAEAQILQDLPPATVIRSQRAAAPPIETFVLEQQQQQQ